MSFWKIFFGSLLGVIVGIFLLVLISGIIISGIVSTFSKEETVSVKSNSVLEMTLDYEIPEQTDYQPFAGFSFTDFQPTVSPGLYDILKTIKKAKGDADIKGIYLNSGFVNAGMATIDQIRNALIDFRKSGKFVIAYTEVSTEKTYYLNSVADKIYVNPKGAIEFNGISVRYPFYKEMLQKLGVETQVFYDGKFKTATEPYRLDSMSKENKLMTSVLINDIQNRIINNIAVSRNIDPMRLDSINKNLAVRNTHDAKRYNLVDGEKFEDEVFDDIKMRLHIGQKDKITFIPLAKYMKAPGTENNGAGTDRIAVLFAAGDIVDGKGGDDYIGSSKYAEQLQKLRDDNNVKAVVLRVNSPGGSSLASDVIAHEVELTKLKKPVVISMGDYAASGGYYISALASKIVAQPNTLTGSIGVFAIFPNFQKLCKDKLGITVDGVSTGKYSDFPNLNRPLRADEKLIIQNEVDTIYDQFKSIVVRGRNIDRAKVDSIAQGRVWTGVQGLQLGLVDTLGGLDDAIKIAAHLAHLASYRISEYPEKKNAWYQFAKMVTESRETKVLKEKLGTYYPMVNQLKSLMSMKGIQARLPSLIEIE
ncbi:MAG: signal peptide peptidase SppA [Chitinophagales bacterium]|nr:signal peptide peptidase SppA [Chitinophagales bacterium]